MASYLDKDGLQTVWSKIKAQINASKSSILNSAYPVGAIYMSISSTSPASLFGGTWEEIHGRFLLGASGDYEAGETGGEDEHTLTIDEMPSHWHLVDELGYVGNVSEGSGFTVPVVNNYGSQKADMATSSTGGSKPHNNMPPYLVVYMWKRTA